MGEGPQEWPNLGLGLSSLNWKEHWTCHRMSVISAFEPEAGGSLQVQVLAGPIVRFL